MSDEIENYYSRPNRVDNDSGSEESYIILDDIIFLKNAFGDKHPLIDEAYNAIIESGLKGMSHRTKRKYLENLVIRLEAFSDPSAEKYREYVDRTIEYDWERLLKKIKQ